MGRKNYQGQILLEVCVVIAFIMLVGFIAIGHLEELKSMHAKNKFTRGPSHVLKNSSKNKK
jgi:hypothetical protein